MRTTLLAAIAAGALAATAPLGITQPYQAPAAGGGAPAAQGQAAAPANPQVAEGEEDYTELVRALATSPHSLLSGIEQVATGTEVPIEAKFEVEDGTFFLSVYTAEKGLEVLPEENSFKEFKGDGSQAAWTPETEVFEDFEHIARSASYATLLAMTEVTIPDIIETASANGATVFSVKAKVIDGKPVFEVMTVTNGEVSETLYDLMTAQPAA